MIPIILPLSLTARAPVRAAFLGRVAGWDVALEKAEAMSRLRAPHQAAAAALGFPREDWIEAEQVHGATCAVVDGREKGPVPGADALATNKPGVCLAIAVADCAAVFLADQQGRAVALVHSGRRGTERNICGEAVRVLRNYFKCQPSSLCAWISPCIRPPHYELDFAANIRHQLADAGVAQIDDCGLCTASHPDFFYSYRREKGRTGRMLALMALAA